MTDISKRFEQIITSTQKKFLDQGTIMPTKTDRGIAVGCALITCDGSYKNIYRYDELVFANVSLNRTAIRLANMIAWNKSVYSMQPIYDADQYYNRLYIDTTVFLAGYKNALKHDNHSKAEILWIRYCDTRERTKLAKEKAERLASF